MELSAELARIRGPALYGYEVGIPAREAFGREYAENIYHRIKEIVNLCSEFLKTTIKF